MLRKRIAIVLQNAWEASHWLFNIYQSNNVELCGYDNDSWQVVQEC